MIKVLHGVNNCMRVYDTRWQKVIKLNTKLDLNKGGYLKQVVYSSERPMCTRHKKMHCAFFILNNNSKNPDVKLISPNRPADISQTEPRLLCCGRGMLMVCRGRCERRKFSGVCVCGGGGSGVSTAMIHTVQSRCVASLLTHKLTFIRFSASNILALAASSLFFRFACQCKTGLGQTSAAVLSINLN